MAKMPHPKMIYRFLGNSGLRVSVVGLGGAHRGHIADDIVYETFKAAYDAGVNFFDSAEAYNAGRAETLLGNAIKKYGWDRDDLVISTKLYWGQHDDGSTGINGEAFFPKRICCM